MPVANALWHLWYAMKRTVLFSSVIGVILFLSGASAQTTTTNADVIRMVKAGTPDSEIIAVIRSTLPRYQFTQIEELTKAGVSDEVIKAMAARSSGTPPSNASASKEPVAKRNAGAYVQAADKKPERQLSNEEIQAAYNVTVKALPRILKAPFTAHYAPIEETSITPGGAGFRNSIVVRIYVDSQNSFGAMLRTRFLCRVGPQRRDGLYSVKCGSMPN